MAPSATTRKPRREDAHRQAGRGGGRDGEAGASWDRGAGGHVVGSLGDLGRRRDGDLGEAVGREADPDLRPPAARPLDEPERKVVEQLVRDHHARRELDRGELGQRGRDRTDVLDRPWRLVRLVALPGSRTVGSSA